MKERAMLIDISDIVFGEQTEMTKAVPIGLTAFVSKLGEFPITRKTPLELQITHLEDQRFRICGHADLSVSIPCSRCLTGVPTELHPVIDRTFQVRGSLVIEEDGSAGEGAGMWDGAGPDEEPPGVAEASEPGESPDYLDGWKLDSDRLIYGEILMEWPMKVLCRADCRGICSVCGADLNQGECGCQRTAPDPRMAAIQDIFNKFKEV